MPRPVATPPVGTRPVLRTVGGPLILYHLLILAGAYFLLLGYANGTRGLELLGLAVIVAGIATEGAILAWSARLVRLTGARTGGSVAPATLTFPGEDRMCIRCGRVASEETTVCPRCGGSVVKVAAPPGPEASVRPAP